MAEKGGTKIFVITTVCIVLILILLAMMVYKFENNDNKNNRYLIRVIINFNTSKPLNVLILDNNEWFYESNITSNLSAGENESSILSGNQINSGMHNFEVYEENLNLTLFQKINIEKDIDLIIYISENKIEIEVKEYGKFTNDYFPNKNN
jgi:hypothetical protein